MKSNRKMKESLVTFFVKYYIVFTIAVVLLGILFFYVYLLAEEGILKFTRPGVLPNQEKLLAEGTYERLDFKRILGKEGYFEILGQENHVVYASNGKKNSYTKEELVSISKYDMDEVVQVQDYRTKEDEIRILIEKFGLEDASKGEFLVLDEEYHILYSTMSYTKRQFTQREYEYLTQTGNGGYDTYQYPFQGPYGTENTLLLHIKRVSEKSYEKLTLLSKLVIPVFIVAYSILTGFFIFLLKRKIKKPLGLLEYAMQDFVDGKRDMPIDYSGPRELEGICDSFNEMAKHLKESEQKQKSMLADISHDLKTPITVIQGYSRAICDGIIGEDKKEKYLNTIYHKSNVLTELINTFYEYSKLEHPDFSITPERQDICEYCREYLAEKYEEIDIAGFQLKLTITAAPVMVMFDRMLLKRVLENIIANALKHNPSGTTLFFILTVEHSTVKITIGDNGAGIREKIADRIFEPFAVGDDSRNNRQGSGLGLAIAKKIMEAHHGSIRLEEMPQEGMATEFTILLPYS